MRDEVRGRGGDAWSPLYRSTRCMARPGSTCSTVNHTLSHRSADPAHSLVIIRSSMLIDIEQLAWGLEEEEGEEGTILRTRNSCRSSMQIPQRSSSS